MSERRRILVSPCRAPITRVTTHSAFDPGSSSSKNSDELAGHGAGAGVAAASNVAAVTSGPDDAAGADG